MDININQDGDIEAAFHNNNGGEEDGEEEEDDVRNVRRRLNENVHGQNLLQNVENNEDRAVEPVLNNQVVPVGHQNPNAIRAYDRERETDLKRRSANNPEPFKTLVDITRQNIQPIRNATGMLTEGQHLSATSTLRSLHDLQSTETRFNTFLLMYIVSIAGNRTGGTSISHARYGNNRNSTPLKHDRKVILMCPLSPPGSNTCVVLTGGGSSNSFLYGVNISLRDTGLLRPGCCIVIPNPSKTDKFLANSNTPILSVHKPAIIVNSNFMVPERPIPSNTNDISGFCLHNLEVRVLGLQMLNTTCNGFFCDGSSLIQNDVMVAKCPCYQSMGRGGNVIAMVEVKITPRDQDSFTTTICSKFFLKSFCLDMRYFEPGTKQHHFNANPQAELALYNSLDFNTRYTNARGLFRGFGWIKRGEVQDQGVDQPAGRDAERILVDSSITKYHITRLEPMYPHRINPTELRWHSFTNVNDYGNN